MPKTLIDRDRVLAEGLAAIRSQYRVPTGFPPAVAVAAEAARDRVPDQHRDRTDELFVTLDPAGATDLDQAFAIEPSGTDLLLHYAIADVAWFVRDDDPLDAEAWQRGTTIYLPDGKAPLYPVTLSEGAASLLPDVVRPAAIFTVRVAPDGRATLDRAERGLIRSRAKLAYETVRPADLPAGFEELSKRLDRAGAARGAVQLDPPEQEVASEGAGSYRLTYRPRMPAEDQNAALSLATNLAIAATMLAHHTGLFRVMAGPDDGAVRRLRHTAAQLGVAWPADIDLTTLERGLRAAVPREAAMMLAIRRSGSGASYQPYREGVLPWHAPMMASYAQATAPLRRLADRYVIRCVLAIAAGEAVPDAVIAAFERLPQVMAKADALDGQVEHAVIDLAEAVLLQGREGERFTATVTETDGHGARIELGDQPIVARVDGTGFTPGERITVTLTAADPVRRQVRFARAAGSAG